MRTLVLALAAALSVAACSGEGRLTSTSPDDPGQELSSAFSSGGTIQISPSPVSVHGGKSVQLTATVRDASGNVLSNRNVNFSSLDTSIIAVTKNGKATGKMTGQTMIRASSGRYSTLTTASVTPSPIASVTLSPVTSSLAIGLTVQLTATTVDSDGVVVTDRSVAWASTNPTVASVSSSGLVTALAPGSTTIQATCDSVTATMALSVPTAPAPGPVTVASVSVTLNASSLTVGQSTQATAVVRDSASNVLTDRTITWSSSNPAVATVSTSGLVTAVASGTAVIGAVVDGKVGSATLAVNQAPVASVSVSLTSSSILTGQTTQANVTLRDASGNVLTGRTVTWSSSNTAVATVSSSGVVTAVGAGSANITATSEGVGGSAALSVTTSTSASSLLMTSDWTSGLGNASSAIGDANKNPRWNDLHPDQDQLYVVSASGLGFPSNMSNVLRVQYKGISSADVKTLSQWAAPPVGGSMYYRLYYRLDIPNYYGSPGYASHHPIEAQPGSCPFEWEFRVGPNGDGTMDFMLSAANDYIIKLQKFRAYRLEWAFLNRDATNGYKVQIRIYDAASGALVGDQNNLIRRYTTTSLAQDNPTLALDDACVNSLTVGQNGPQWTVGSSANDAFAYYGGMAFSRNGWIGPYVAGEHP